MPDVSGRPALGSDQLGVALDGLLVLLDSPVGVSQVNVRIYPRVGFDSLPEAALPDEDEPFEDSPLVGILA